MNYNIKINLLRFRNAEIVESKKRGRVIVIPIEENEIYVSPKTNSAYLNIRAKEKETDSMSHFLRHHKSNGKSPICGYMSEVGVYKPYKKSKNKEEKNENHNDVNDFKGLPF